MRLPRRPSPPLRARATSLALVALTALAASAPAAQPCEPVADGTRVRARAPRDAPRDSADARTTHVGAALGWSTSAPRLVAASGDTVALTAAHRTWVSRGRTATRLVPGALIGWLAGIGAVVADCGLAATCGEQNPVPLLGLGLGAAIGARVHRERWMPVSPATSQRCAALREGGR